MAWIQFPRGSRLESATGAPTEALVVMLHDLGETAATLVPLAERWALMAPMAAFVAFDGPDRLDPPANGFRWYKLPDRDAGLNESVLDGAVRHLDLLLEKQMHRLRIESRRLVLVGFGQGGTVALHLLLRCGWRCAGTLAFAAQLIRPLPRVISVDGKVRLIESIDKRDGVYLDLREGVASLLARGIDARGVVLTSPALSEEAIRHGGAYLVELIATAQRSVRDIDGDSP